MNKVRTEIVSDESLRPRVGGPYKVESAMGSRQIPGTGPCDGY